MIFGAKVRGRGVDIIKTKVSLVEVNRNPRTEENQAGNHHTVVFSRGWTAPSAHMGNRYLNGGSHLKLGLAQTHHSYLALVLHKSVSADMEAPIDWLVGWLCFTSHRQRSHLEMVPPFTVPCEGREARWLHRSDRESNTELSLGRTGIPESSCELVLVLSGGGGVILVPSPVPLSQFLNLFG